MKSAIFGFVVGVALAMAGASVLDDPFKTIALIAAIAVAKELTT